MPSLAAFVAGQGRVSAEHGEGSLEARRTLPENIVWSDGRTGYPRARADKGRTDLTRDRHALIQQRQGVWGS
jgi:hypothetical protein